MAQEQQPFGAVGGGGNPPVPTKISRWAAAAATSSGRRNAPAGAISGEGETAGNNSPLEYLPPRIDIMECPDCKTDMRLVSKTETGNCSDGCCPSYTELYQCMRCKRIDSV